MKTLNNYVDNVYNCLRLLTKAKLETRIYPNSKRIDMHINSLNIRKIYKNKSDNLEDYCYEYKIPCHDFIDYIMRNKENIYHLPNYIKKLEFITNLYKYQQTLYHLKDGSTLKETITLSIIARRNE